LSSSLGTIGAYEDESTEESEFEQSEFEQSDQGEMELQKVAEEWTAAENYIRSKNINASWNDFLAAIARMNTQERDSARALLDKVIKNEILTSEDINMLRPVLSFLAPLVKEYLNSPSPSDSRRKRDEDRIRRLVSAYERRWKTKPALEA